MIREECYYLTKLYIVSDTKNPARLEQYWSCSEDIVKQKYSNIYEEISTYKIYKSSNWKMQLDKLSP